eukprot:g463.t1
MFEEEEEEAANSTPPPLTPIHAAQQGEQEEGEALRLRALVQQMMQRLHADACARSDLEEQLSSAQEQSHAMRTKLQNLQAGFARREQELKQQLEKQARTLAMMRRSFEQAKRLLRDFAEGACSTMAQMEQGIFRDEVLPGAGHAQDHKARDEAHDEAINGAAEVHEHEHCASMR